MRFRGNVALLCVVLALAPFLAGFSAFDSEGLARFRVADGVGSPGIDGQDWTEIEVEPLFHTLSSRFGGGGVLIYMEYEPRSVGHSGLLMIDLRHAGLADLSVSTLAFPDRRRGDLFYQEWSQSKDLFQSVRVEGDIDVEELYRGEGLSAIGIRFDLVFFAPGDDGKLDTDDDEWRRVEGSATTSPTVAEAIAIESHVVHQRRERGEVYAPDGDIYIDCYGDSHVSEQEYEEETYYYEDDDGGGCEGDTWKDDTEDPQESGGCAGEQAVDDGEPDPDSSCEGTGDELDEPEAACE